MYIGRMTVQLMPGIPKLRHLLYLFLAAAAVVPFEAHAERPKESGYASWSLGVLIPFCILTVLMSAFYCGLTLGLLSINTTTLEIIIDAGPEPDRTYARSILPVRKLGHQLLVTLLIGNMLSAVLTSQLVAAIVDSTELVNFIVGTLIILIFGEIIPMSICNKGSNVLFVGGKSIPALNVSLFLLYPIAKPLGMLLDCVVKHEAGQYYDRNELKKLISVHCDKYSEKSGIDTEQVRIMLRVLELDERTAKSIMTPLSDAFMLEGNLLLDHKLLKSLWEIGKSRLPVYIDHQTNVVGVLYVKDLLTFSIADCQTPSTVYDFVMEQGRNMMVVDANLRIQEILGLFKNRVPHLLFVSESSTGGNQTMGTVSEEIFSPCTVSPCDSNGGNRLLAQPLQNVIRSSKDARDSDRANQTFVGIITLEDVIEELIASEIYDEDEYQEGHSSAVADTNSGVSPSSPFGVSIPSFHRMHVNFYSYGVEDANGPDGNYKHLGEDQKWVLADYMTRTFVSFATLSVSKMKRLIEYVGDRVVYVCSDTPPLGRESAARILYRTGVPTTVFTLLLGGAARLSVEEKLSTELYSFSSLAEEALLGDASFVPNYTVVVTQTSRVLQITSDDLRLVESFNDGENGPTLPVKLPHHEQVFTNSAIV